MDNKASLFALFMAVDKIKFEVTFFLYLYLCFSSWKQFQAEIFL